MKILVHFGNEIREYEISDHAIGYKDLGTVRIRTSINETLYKESGLADGMPIYRAVG